MDRISLVKLPLQPNYPYDKQTPEPIQSEPTSQGSIVPSSQRMERLESIYGSKKLKALGLIPCETCANRTYVDGSNDPGVSFKTPTKISPEASVAAVTAHESEHVSNERAKANANDHEVVSQSVRIFMSVCPECGKSYASGGVTTTQTASKPQYKEKTPVETGVLLDVEV